MKNYFLLLKYTESVKKYIFPYFVLSLLSSFFGIMNFTILIPVLKILFDNNNQNSPTEKLSKPIFDGSLNGLALYIKDGFGYYLTEAVNIYGKMGALQYACFGLILSVFLANFFKYFSQRTLKKVEIRTITSLRQSIFEKTMTLHFGFFNNEKKGNIMAHLTTDVQEVEGSIGRAFSAIFKELFTLIVYFITLFSYSVELTLFSLIIIPLSGITIATITRKLRTYATNAQATLGDMLSLIDEVLGGMRIVKGFNAEQTIIERYKTQNDSFRNLIIKMMKRQELTGPVSETLGVLVVTGILMYGGTLVLRNDNSLSPSTFIAFVALFSQVMRPAKSISDAISNIQRGVASTKRILTLMNTQSAITEIENPVTIEEFQHEIEFKNISFSYQTGRQVLKNISFKIPKGKMVALVGPSGGGKSTIADLLPRFYDPQNGQVLMDGIDIRNLTLKSLSNQVGIVTQESILFNDSIDNNIKFGTQTSQEKVIEAASIANAHQFISTMPEGYNSFIGDRGGKLSGGQRQRLSIARAVLKNPPILILDEATSALDNESEKLVQEALTTLMKNRTTLVIAHRLSTIQHADLILVINNGEIIESGTHAELINKADSFYQKLNNLQEPNTNES
ncbi:MAG: ABC transporter ATP-binding protein [Pseudarcicella sp.]|nr:ABC transporter ATP-binding protein [Pseudarcicella sp.]MBP6411430.1 ABC transporter ATP-binding protein [Pseudarcicella sp.]